MDSWRKGWNDFIDNQFLGAMGNATTTASLPCTDLKLEDIRAAIKELNKKPYAVGSKKDLAVLAKAYNESRDLHPLADDMFRPPNGDYFSRDFHIRKSTLMEAGTVWIIKQPLADKLTMMPDNAITIITDINSP